MKQNHHLNLCQFRYKLNQIYLKLQTFFNFESNFRYLSTIKIAL